MKVFLRLLWLDLCRALWSTRFAVAALAVAAAMLLACSGLLADTPDVLYLMVLALSGSGSTFLILGVLPIVPYGMAFASDAEEKATSFWMIRTGVTEYTLAKLIVAAMSGFLVVVVGMAVFVLGFSVFLPLFVSSPSGDAYAVLLEQGRPIAYIACLSVHYGLTGALFAGGAVALSTRIPDKFVVLSAPIVLFFFLLRITSALPLPGFLKPSSLFDSIYAGATPLATILYKLLSVFLLVGLFASFAVHQMKGRMNRT